MLICDSHPSQKAHNVMQFLTRIRTALKILEAETQHANWAKLNVGLIKESTRKDTSQSGSPMVLWDYCMEWVALIYNCTTKELFQLNGTNPYTATLSDKADISNVMLLAAIVLCNCCVVCCSGPSSYSLTMWGLCCCHGSLLEYKDNAVHWCVSAVCTWWKWYNHLLDHVLLQLVNVLPNPTEAKKGSFSTFTSITSSLLIYFLVSLLLHHAPIFCFLFCFKPIRQTGSVF